MYSRRLCYISHTLNGVYNKPTYLYDIGAIRITCSLRLYHSLHTSMETYIYSHFVDSFSSFLISFEHMWHLVYFIVNRHINTILISEEIVWKAIWDICNVTIQHTSCSFYWKKVRWIFTYSSVGSTVTVRWYDCQCFFFSRKRKADIKLFTSYALEICTFLVEAIRILKKLIKVRNLMRSISHMPFEIMHWTWFFVWQTFV